MIVNIPELGPALEALYLAGDFEQLLRNITQLNLHLLQRPELRARALFEPVSDRILQRFSLAHFGRPRSPKAKTILHIATEVYDVGGHTRVLEDIVSALPEFQHTLILTDMRHHYSTGALSLGILAERFEKLGIRVLFLKRQGSMDRLLELDQMIEIISPSTIFLNAHHFDTVTYGVANHTTAPRVLFLHHADFQPSLGATRPDYVHVDLTVNCHDHCCAMLGEKPTMLFMTVKDFGIRQADFTQPLTGVSAGAAYKYAGRAGFTYGELIAELVASGVSTMHHIGDVTTEQVVEWRAQLVKRGQREDSIVFHGNVPSLALALQNISPHFYLNSHPVGGMKALIEAMSVGLPFVHVHTPEKLPLFRWPDTAYGKAIIIKSLKDALTTVRQLRERGEAQGQHNRELYESQFAPAVFQRQLRSLVA